MTASANEAGRPLDLWGQRGWHGQEVVGESNYTKEIRKLFGRRLRQEGEEIHLTAQLVPEPHNRHDPNAVSVRVNGMTVGYLPREDAELYAPVLTAIIEQGWFPQVSARVWGGDQTRYDYDRRGRMVEQTEFVGSVRLDLAEPHLLAPMNPPPADVHALLPRGKAIQVTGEDEHMPTLMPLLSPAGEGWIHATLHEVVEPSARTAKTLVEVRVNGGTVGRLTPKMSSELLPAIRHLAERGVQAVARAILKGNSVKVDVVLYVARANEIPQEWLDSPPIQRLSRPVTAAAAVARSGVASQGDSSA